MVLDEAKDEAEDAMHTPEMHTPEMLGTPPVVGSPLQPGSPVEVVAGELGVFDNGGDDPMRALAAIDVGGLSNVDVDHAHDVDTDERRPKRRKPVAKPRPKLPMVRAPSRATLDTSPARPQDQINVSHV